MSVIQKWLPTVSWLSVVTGLVFGAIVHITAIFALPYVSANNAWYHVEQQIPVNRILIFPSVTEGVQLFPFMAPDIRYALCRYDLKEGPVSLRLPEIGRLWSVALYDRYSQNFFVVSGAEIVRKDIELLLNLPRDENAAAEPSSSSTAGSSGIITVRVPEREGLAIVRAPIRSIAYTKQVDDGLQRVKCRPADKT